MSVTSPLSELARRLAAVRDEAQAAFDALTSVTHQQAALAEEICRKSGEKGDLASRIALLEAELRDAREKLSLAEEARRKGEIRT